MKIAAHTALIKYLIFLAVNSDLVKSKLQIILIQNLEIPNTYIKSSLSQRNYIGLNIIQHS